MDHIGKIPRKQNPRENANLLSLLTFCYTGGMFKKSFKKDLEETDLYDVVKCCEAKKNGDRIEKEWKKYFVKDKNNTTATNKTILKILFKCFGPMYFFLGLTNLTWKLLSSIYEPEAISKFVSYFNPKQTTIQFEDALFYGCLKIGLKVGHALYIQNYIIYVQQLAIRIRTSFCSLVYRKALKLTPLALNDISLGNVITIITKDVMVFEHNMMLFNDLWIEIIRLIVVCYLLYNKMGAVGFIGVGVVFIIVPFQIYVAKLIKNLRLDLSKKTDERLQATQETLSAIKIIKMYTWEKVFSKKIEAKRRKEMRYLMKSFYLRSLNFILGMLMSKIGFYVLIMAYITVYQTADAGVIFYAMKVFGDIKHSIAILIPFGLGRGAELYASLLRINKVLISDELIDNNDNKQSSTTTTTTQSTSSSSSSSSNKSKVYLKDINVSIRGNEILKNINTEIKPGLTIITGPLGSGKSTLLKLLLNDIPIDDPSNGKLFTSNVTFSYCSQDPWLFPSSIKQNIIFGQSYDEQRYNNVINVCALDYDFNMFEYGDETIVADRGLNLSGGQQARINLARAIYKISDIYLLDDPLHALDPNVQDYVFDNCIMNFLNDKQCVLITHNMKHKNYANQLILMDNGEIKYDGKPYDYKIPIDILKEIEMDEKYEKELKEKQNKKKINNDYDDSTTIDEQTKLIQRKSLKTDRKKIYSEIKKTGKVDFAVFKKYFAFGGGFLLFGSISLLFIGSEFTESYSSRLLTNWINIEQNVTNLKFDNLTTSNTNHSIELKNQSNFILKLYSFMIICSVILDLIKQWLFINFARKASINLHNEMIEKLTTAVMKFYDNYFIGNILNRFSQDLTKVDEHLPHTINHFIRIALSIGGILALVSSVNWQFLIPATILVILLIIVQRLYIPAARSLKRLESATRSPLIGHLNATMEGVTTIRASKAQKILIEEFDRHQDLYTSAHYMSFCIRRAFGFFMDILSSIFITVIIGKLLFYNTGEAGGDVGLAITKASSLAALVQWGLLQWSDLENDMTSVERVLEYTEIEQDQYNGIELLKINWPNNGEIIYKNLSLTYKSEKILKNINFNIKPNEKIGIVGRTGAGKSSIISTLFRLYNYNGQILIDGIDIKTIALDSLRNNISIIPQEPLLFQGTIRQNIDPYNQYSDETIWKILKLVHMTQHIPKLNLIINDHGTNFSTGQRQLICLARAIIKKNKIVVLDEATANMDPDTELLAQNVIKENFTDCTMLIIAHRLHSVIECDKIIVMDKGEIVEFDQPQILINNKNSYFSKMLASDV